MFINGHKRPDVIEDRQCFYKVMKELEPYLVEFDKTGQMIPKIYSSDCEFGGDKQRPVIIITHDECIFLSNDSPCFRWHKDRDTFL